MPCRLVRCAFVAGQGDAPPERNLTYSENLGHESVRETIPWPLQLACRGKADEPNVGILLRLCARCWDE